jgi:dihydropteroate synthase
MNFGDRTIDLTTPRIMGVLNVTPDSFSDGGKFASFDRAVRRAQQMVDEGAAFIDIGGESTRPGAAPVTLQEELERVCSVIEAVAQRLDVVVSIDTSHPDVMREAVRAGARLINDVRALRRPGAVAAAAALKVPVCLMHMQGEPAVMQEQPVYSDVVSDVCAFLQQQLDQCIKAGIAAETLLIDPGFGFGKSLEHNLLLMRRLECLVGLGYPVLVGVSRKSMIGALIDRSVDERITGSATAAAIAVLKGASIIRAHDVRENLDAIKIAMAIRGV